MAQLKIINKSGFPLPEYKTDGAAGLDLQAVIDGLGWVEIGGFEQVKIHTGLFMQIPAGYEGQIRPRSSMAKKRLYAFNGTIDSDYRGEILILLENRSIIPQTVKHGDRIAQIVFSQCEQLDAVEVDVLGNTKRGENGFGSTGR